MMCVFERQSLTALKAGKCARVEWMKAFCMFYRSTPSFAYNFDYTLGRGWVDGWRERVEEEATATAAMRVEEVAEYIKRALSSIHTVWSER
jgi:hypothetical protein